MSTEKDDYPTTWELKARAICAKNADELKADIEAMSQEQVYSALDEALDIAVTCNIDGEYRYAFIRFSSDLCLDTSNGSMSYNYAGYEEFRLISRDVVTAIDDIIAEWFQH